jgi:hypothetical protein
LKNQLSRRQTTVNLTDDDFYDDQAELDDNLVLLDELFSSKDEHFLLKYAPNPLPLHPYTNTSTNEFCTNLISTFRKANLCKTYSLDMLKLIHLALPQPNNLPTSVNAVLKYIRVKLLFLIKYQRISTRSSFIQKCIAESTEWNLRKCQYIVELIDNLLFIDNFINFLQIFI